MGVKLIVHHKRPAPSPAEEAGGNKRQRTYYKLPLLEEYYEFRFDDDLDDDMVEADYKFDLDSIESYEILGEFGPSGVAKAARDRTTGETVAVKRVHPTATPTSEGEGEGEGGGGGPATTTCAVLREASCLDACAGHPSFQQLKAIAADEKTGDLFIVTEHLGAGSGTLRSRLTRPFSEAETRAFMRQLLRAADKMHGAGVTHRDINPDNIVVGPHGELKICGFQCAIMPTERFVGEPHPPMGSVRYRSPSQLGGLRCYCPEEDMWALGCVMAELLAGQPLFPADTDEDVLDQTLWFRDEIVMMGVERFVFDDDAPMPELSLAGRELLAGLLNFDDGRPTAADALKHRWFTEEDVKAKSLALTKKHKKRKAKQSKANSLVVPRA